jgi:hypothetical protein
LEKKETEVIRSTKTISFAGCLAVAAMLCSAGMAAADGPVPPPVPGNIQVEEGHQAFLMTHAVGTQNYICLAAGSPWTFIGPQATVFNDEAEQSLTHYLSPNPDEGGLARATWQHSHDTSAVWALAVAISSDPAFVAPNAIPWLRLAVVGAEAGPSGGDKLTATTFIQRVNTAGGIAPLGGCPAVGARTFVPYEADYIFYKAR